MPLTILRRDFIRGALGATFFAPAITLTGARALAQGLTPLDPTDPTAHSLGFVTDATQVQASANPTFKAGQHCAACSQFQGKATDASAPCTIYAGHTVPGGGWCRVFTPRSA
jgi:hypothetical protein